MDIIVTIATTIFEQLQKPTLSFLIGGMLLAALGSKFEVPEPVYKFIVILLLLKVGLGAGISVREADLISLLVPAIGAAIVGIAIVVLGSYTLARRKGVSQVDGLATVGLFGAVSASTLAASMAMLDDSGIAYEGFIGALYPFMDIAALVTAIVMAKVAAARKTATSVSAQGGTMTMGGGAGGIGSNTGQDPVVEEGLIKGILVDTFRSPAISALLWFDRPGHRHLCPARQRLQKLLRAAISGSFVDPDAHYGDGGLLALCRTAQSGSRLYSLRDNGADHPRAHGLWRWPHRSPSDGLLGRRHRAPFGDGGLQL